MKKRIIKKHLSIMTKKEAEMMYYNISLPCAEQTGIYLCSENMDRKVSNKTYRCMLRMGEVKRTDPPHIVITSDVRFFETEDSGEFATLYKTYVPSRLPGSRETKKHYKKRFTRAIKKVIFLGRYYDKADYYFDIE